MRYLGSISVLLSWMTMTLHISWWCPSWFCDQPDILFLPWLSFIWNFRCALILVHLVLKFLERWQISILAFIPKYRIQKWVLRDNDGEEKASKLCASIQRTSISRVFFTYYLSCRQLSSRKVQDQVISLHLLHMSKCN